MTDLEKAVLQLESPCRVCGMADTCGRMCHWFERWVSVKWPGVQSVLKNGGET